MLTSVALDQYYREHIALKSVARRRAEYAMEALNSFFDDIPLTDIDIPLCREYRVHRVEVGDSTVRRELGVLQAAVNHAVRWRRLKVRMDEMPSIELPSAASVKPIWLFKDELSHLLEVAEKVDSRAFRFLQLAYHTASRKRAIETLSWHQVDLSARRIDLATQGEVATKKRRPIVPISEAMAEQLRTMKSIATTDFVLGNNRDIGQAFAKVARKAGLEVLKKTGLRNEGRLSPHILRHSRATHLLESGKSPWAVASLLGDTVQTLLRVYGHANPDFLAEVIN